MQRAYRKACEGQRAWRRWNNGRWRPSCCCSWRMERKNWNKVNGSQSVRGAARGVRRRAANLDRAWFQQIRIVRVERQDFYRNRRLRQKPQSTRLICCSSRRRDSATRLSHALPLPIMQVGCSKSRGGRDREKRLPFCNASAPHSVHAGRSTSTR
jgi:hypothetical protein